MTPSFRRLERDHPVDHASSMPSESKDEEEKKDDRVTRRGSVAPADLDPLVLAFSEFCTTEAFEGEVNEFFQANCAEFQGMSLADEQRLCWTQLHDQFLGIVERQLETFSKEHDISAEAVFKLLSNVGRARARAYHGAGCPVSARLAWRR